MYNLELLKYEELERVEIDGKRYYQTPDGVFPSVTTVLSEHYVKDLSWWIERVGEEEAEKIKNQAAFNGTKLHEVLEADLYNKSIDGFHSIDRMRYMPVKRLLEKHITKVYASEIPLWSKRLKTAGTCDSVLEWDSAKTILDLKSTKKYKKVEYIPNYFTQACAYGIMVDELYSLGIEKVVIVFSMEDFNCYYFEKPMKDLINETIEIFTGRNENSNIKLHQRVSTQ